MSDERSADEWRVGGPRVGGPVTFMGFIETRDIQEGDVVVVGLPFDTATLYRTGSRMGPRSIRMATSGMLGYMGRRETRPIFAKRRFVDYGDIRPYHGYVENSFERFQRKLEDIVNPGGFPVVLGGDHSVSLPVMRALAPKHGVLSHLHFDAHTDFYEGTPLQPIHHGTIFRQAAKEGLIDLDASVQVGIRGSVAIEMVDEVRAAGYKVITGSEFHRMGVDGTLDLIRSTVRPPVYVSLDIDVVDPAFAPGTGAPESGGIYSREMIELIRGLKGIGAVGFDVVEVSPPYDNSDITAVLAANLAWEFMLTLED